MRTLPHRIHVIGGPGSGKTTLARQLAARLDVQLHDLDRVAYVHGAGARRPLPERLADVAAIQCQPAWISEGIYLWWTDSLLESAETIVWLDLPWRVAAFRIVLRHVRTSLDHTNRHPGLSNLMRFLHSSHRYYVDAELRPPATPDDDGQITRAGTAAALASHLSRVVRCSNQAEVAALVRRFDAPRQPAA